jgi:Fe-S cluster biogenesis protein NfuA
MNKEEVIEKIQIALEQIRPFLMDDGGDIEFIELTDDYVVKVQFLGACRDCSMSAMTLKGGVEEAIKKGLPQIQSVIMVEASLEV